MQQPVHVAFVAVLEPEKDIHLTLFTPPLLCISRGDQRLRATASLGLPCAAALSLWQDISTKILSSAAPLAAGEYAATWGSPCGGRGVYKIICERRFQKAHRRRGGGCCAPLAATVALKKGSVRCFGFCNMWCLG